MNLPVADTIHPQSNKSPMGVQTKAMVELNLKVLLRPKINSTFSLYFKTM